jgi:7-cyano-7-deazaguanine synthase in queuosine biosynthesis
MKWHVYPTIGVRDLFRPDNIRSGDRELRIPIDSSGIPNEIRSEKTWKILDSRRLKVQNVAVELYRTAVAVFSADMRILRNTAFDRWTRDIALYIPVSDIALWEDVTELIQEFLSFLTGDHWTIYVREYNALRPAFDRNEWRKGKSLGHSAASLFSGGLDSFIGAVDTLSTDKGIILVGHYQEGFTKSAQTQLFNYLTSHFPPDQIDLLQFYICPPKSLTDEEESSSRSRSFLFLALGILVASALADDARLIVPENGFISLNIPLTGTRLGSLSTRTTHPHTLHLFEKLIAELGIRIPIETPYRFITKGEMLEQAKEQSFVQKYVRDTLSCAHPSQARWDKKDPNKHCGYCVPCLIRRAAMHRVGLDSPEDYTYDVLNALPSGERTTDVSAFLIALEHSKSRSLISSILQSGPLHATSTDIGQYLGVYERGLREVADFLNERAW